MTDNITSDEDLVGLRMGAIVNVKGKLDAVITKPTNGLCAPYLCVAGPDWSLIYVNLADEATARSIRTRLGAYVTVKAEVTSEDAELEAIAMWEMGGGVPLPLRADVS